MYGVIDVGSTRIKLLVYQQDGRRTYEEYFEFPIGVDGTHDAEGIYRIVKHLILKAKEKGARLVGIATYRGSVLTWRRDGTPVTPILTWLYKVKPRTKYRFLARLPKIGVVFSDISPLMRIVELTKGEWAGKCKDCLTWTLESYLVYRLTGKFLADATNAAMTGLIHPKDFREISLVKELARVDLQIPEIVDNVWDFGEPYGLPLRVVIADQQAAAVGEGALEVGVAKATFGTGVFVDIPTREYKQVKGLIPLILLRYRGSTYRGLEGYLPAAGLVLERLLEWGFLRNFDELDELVEFHAEVPFFLPALTGLQVPSLPWIKGLILGLTLATSKRDIITSYVLSLAAFVRMVLERSGEEIRLVKIDGGMSRSTKLAQCLSALINGRVIRNEDIEGTARGVATLLAVYEGVRRIGDIYGKEIEVPKSPNQFNCLRMYNRWAKRIRCLGSLRRLFQEG